MALGGIAMALARRSSSTARRSTSGAGSGIWSDYGGTGGSCLSMTIVAMTCSLAICVIIAYHSYFQLGSELDSARLFITNKIDGFENELNGLLSDIGSPPPVPVVAQMSLEPPPLHKLTCPKGELLQYWKQTTKHDINYVSPFRDYGPKDKYVTFEPGRGNVCTVSQQVILLLCICRCWRMEQYPNANGVSLGICWSDRKNARFETVLI
jgi:hypothetical protein